ncbi:MAG: TetR/AcrR family transcriptional regulator [Lachnospiraceae bacterium]|nr:TetR/AcrR family transcriptional regulator [Lachnospiraceae bacterium]
MDARTRYTKMMIRNTFISILKEKPVSRITVTEICEGAQINRSTFYKYYDNPGDLMNKLEEEYLQALKDKLNEIDMSDFARVYAIILTDIKDNQDYFSTIISENGDENFRDSVFSLIYQSNLGRIRELFPSMSPLHQKWLFYYFGEGLNGMLQQWMDGGMTESVEDLVNFANALITTVNDHLKDYM